MSDPHVQYVCSQLETDTPLRFDHPPSCEHETAEFTLCLADDVLTCTMKAHYASADAARAVIDPFIRAWELDVALHWGQRVMRYVYQKANLIDRDPPPPGTPQVIRPTAIESLEVIDPATVVLTQPYYPAPSRRFIVSVDVETLWRRYEGYMQGGEPLPGMAYVCQSFIEKVLARGRGDAAMKYHIEPKVLETLGRLHSHRGDLTNRGKLEHEGELHEPPLTSRPVPRSACAIYLQSEHQALQAVVRESVECRQ